jgi:hypothetical protein
LQYGNPNYRLVVSDETKENVILRICASKLEPLKGPDIKKGDVIRVHRVTVIINLIKSPEKLILIIGTFILKAQVEYTILTSCHEMVLSTTPHRNYVIFSLEPGKIVCDSLAKTFTYNDGTAKK